MALLLVPLIPLGSLGQAGPAALMELTGGSREAGTRGAFQGLALELAHCHSWPGTTGQSQGHG